MSVVARLRVVAQSLVRVPGLPLGETPADVLTRLGAIQSQELASGLLATWLRTPDAHPTAVQAALAEGTLVRTWTMRQTLFLVLAGDARRYLGLTGARMERSATSRLRQLSIAEADLVTARRAAERLLVAGGGATRPELFAAFEAAGQPTGNQRGVHLLAILSHRAVLVQGPLRGREQEFRLTEQWLPAAEPEGPEDALEALAGRFLTGHGPADEVDLAWWLGLPVGQVRGPFRAAARAFTALPYADRTLWCDPAVAALGEAPDLAHRVALVPRWDELVLGYREREPVLGPYAARATAGGVFKPLVTVGGRAIGLWSREGTGRTPRVGVEWFETDTSAADLEPVARRVEHYWAVTRDAG